MSDTGTDDAEIAKFDRDTTKRFVDLCRPMMKTYFRSEVRGLESFPPGAALVVSNHSGGLLPVDWPVFAVDFYDRFGYDRPIHLLTHDVMFHGPTADMMRRLGFIHANRDNAVEALRAGGVVLDFPGGQWDVYRPTRSENVVDFDGHTGYARVAVDAGAPIVPAVSIGGQQNQLYLSRGDWLVRALRLSKVGDLTRSNILPITFGFPFGLSVLFPVNIPLPTKIVTRVLQPIDVAAQFGADPDIGQVDAQVRQVMQQGLDELAAKRRFPILG